MLNICRDVCEGMCMSYVLVYEGLCMSVVTVGAQLRARNYTVIPTGKVDTKRLLITNRKWLLRGHENSK